MDSSRKSAYRLLLISAGFNVLLFLLGILVLSSRFWVPVVFPDWWNDSANSQPSQPLPLVAILLYMAVRVVRFLVGLVIYLVVGVGLTASGIVGSIWTGIGAVIVESATDRSGSNSLKDSSPDAGPVRKRCLG
ncbi:hypothetical protein GC197_11760 [bacterium]|nr:hypothetical protein [bacterium]